MYYLQNRYYDPTTGRFLNADEQLNLDQGVLGTNLYAYCLNNSVNLYDPDGRDSIWIIKPCPDLIFDLYNRVQYQKQSLRFITKIIRKFRKMDLTYYLFLHALEKNPKDLFFGENSNMVKAIKNSKEFKIKISQIIKKSNDKNIDAEDLLVFNSGDLFGAIHACTIKVTGSKNNGVWSLNVSIHDYYNFKFEKENMLHPLIIANNFANMCQPDGTVGNYDIYINFKIKI